MTTPEEFYCPKRDDHQHCEHWFDGAKCCACGAPAMTDEEREAQGMEPTEENK